MVTVSYSVKAVINEYGEIVGDTITVSDGRVSAITFGAYPSYATRRVMDGYILPGFVDAHLHIAGLGLALTGVDLRGARDPWEVAEALSGASGPIAYGRGWDQESFRTEKRYPTRKELDSAVPDRPALAVRVCGHVAVANSVALATARPWEVYPDLVDKDKGILLEDAVGYTLEKLLENTDLTGIVGVALEALARAGIAGVASLSCTPAEARALRDLESQGHLKLRVSCYPEPPKLSQVLEIGSGRRWRVTGVKIFADGSLGARTAYLREPYSDDPGNRGLRLLDAGRIRDAVEYAASRRLRTAVHAIGDAALDEVIEAFESSGLPCDTYCRVEHASVAWPGQVKRLAELRAYVVVQPHFRVSDWWIDKRLGPHRLAAVYPFATMLRSGVKLAVSTDAPVEPYQPWETFKAAVGRCGQPACRSEESLKPHEVIEAYTIRAAEASGGPAAALGTLRRGAPAALSYTPTNPLKEDWEGPLRLIYHEI
ncbi:MAG: amidohydrolase [Desulfurococcales archaeon]|nr:amidohydrolase [Desulfurococcales archaeon]